jgi:hypothetical protein
MKVEPRHPKLTNCVVRFAQALQSDAPDHFPVSVVVVVLVKRNGHGEDHRQKGEQNQGELHLGNSNERLRIVSSCQREKNQSFYILYLVCRN